MTPTPAGPEERGEGLREALERLRDHGYQPMYNGRPSCPFCHNFVDDEETHHPGCILLSAATPAPATGAERETETLRAALRAWLDSHGEADIEERLADAANEWLEAAP